jgi:flagellar protein FliL
MPESVEQSTVATANPKKKSRKPLILGVIGAIVLGGIGYFITNTGIFKFGGNGENQSGVGHAAVAMSQPMNATFVALERMIISLGKEQSGRHLIFAANIEVDPLFVAEVTNLIPRFSDVLNTYLRAVSVDELESPSSLFKLRSHMLRRIQIVAGSEKVKDLLISEFVID